MLLTTLFMILKVPTVLKVETTENNDRMTKGYIYFWKPSLVKAYINYIFTSFYCMLPDYMELQQSDSEPQSSMPKTWKVIHTQ